MAPKRSSGYAEDHARLVDDLMAGYVTWREKSVAVAASYQNWTTAPRDERAAAFAAYVAALDREEHAASAYQRVVAQSSAS